MPYQDIAAVWATLQFRTDSDSVVREILGHYQMQLTLQPQHHSAVIFAHVTWLKVLFDLQRLHLHKQTNDTKHILRPSTALACLVHTMRLRAPETEGLCSADEELCLNLPELIIHTVLSGLRALQLMPVSLSLDQKHLLKTTWVSSWSLQKLKPMFGPVFEKLWLEAIDILPVVNYTVPALQPAGGFCELHNCAGGLSPLTGQPHTVVRELLAKLKNDASAAYFLPLYDILWGCEAALIDHASLKHDQQDSDLLADEKLVSQVIRSFPPEGPKTHGHYSASVILIETFCPLLVKQGTLQEISEPTWKRLTKSFLVDLDAFMISRNDEMRDPDGSISLLLNGEQGVIELTRKWTESSPIGYDTIEGAEAYIVDCPDFHPVSFSALASQLEDASYIREPTEVLLNFDTFRPVRCPRCEKKINRARLIEPLVEVSQLIQDRIRPVQDTSHVAQPIESAPISAPPRASRSSASESRRDSRVSSDISSSMTSKSDSHVSSVKKSRRLTFPWTKSTSNSAGLSTQPQRPIQAAFSAAGSHLVLWNTHVNDDQIVILSTSGARNSDNRLFCTSIRLVGCGTNCVVAIKNDGEIVTFEKSQAAAGDPQSSFKLEPDDVPYCVAVSRDDTHIAIGFGSYVTVLKLDKFKVIECTRINLLGTQSTEQVVNFSVDGSAVITASRATNRKDTGQDTLIHFWKLAGASKVVETDTTKVAKIATTYPQLGKSGDDFGIRSVFYDNTNRASVLAACVQDKHNVAQSLGSKQPPLWSLSGIQCASQSHDGSIYCFVVQDSRTRLVAHNNSFRNPTHEINLSRTPTSQEDQLMMLTASADPSIVYGCWNEGSRAKPKMKLAKIDLKINTTEAVKVQDIQERIMRRSEAINRSKP